MSKITYAVNYLLQDIEPIFKYDHSYTSGEINEIDIILHPKDLEAYMNPPSDILEPGQESPCESDDSLTLGSYSEMSSPGVVRLYLDNLKDFFHSLVFRSLRAGHAFCEDLVELLTGKKSVFGSRDRRAHV